MCCVAVRAVERKDWDPSVKSLAAFPQILAMMDDKPEWTERLGDAFLAQESQVMDSVQHLRQRAYAEGRLRSNERIRVVPQGPAIVIVPANPEIVYVHPYYYHRTVVINPVHNNTVVRRAHAAPGGWQHDPAHRRGAPYRGTGARASFAAENAQMNLRPAPPAAQPQARAMDNNRYTVRESRARVDEHTAEAARRAGIRQETRHENRDDRRRQDVAARIEHRNEDTRRSEAPPTVRARLLATPPRAEQQAVRPVPKPIPQPRTESAAHTAPPHTETLRARAPQEAAPARESRPAGGPRRGGREREN